MAFYEMIGRHYDMLFPASLAQQEFLEKQLPKRGKVLDLGCATGGYALHLASLGHEVTAVDLDMGMIEQLKSKISGQEISLKPYCADIRALDCFGSDYDLIYCIGNTLVHLESLTEVRTFVQKAYEMLRTGGRLVIQSVNYDRILKNQVQTLPEIHRENPELHFYRSYKHEPGSIEFVGLLEDGAGSQWRESTRLLPILKEDLKKAFILAGFSEMGIYGDFKEQPFTLESPALVTMTVK